MRILNLFMVVSLLLNSCITTNNITNNFMENDINSIHPAFKIYHKNESKSLINYQLNTSELLYTRVNKNSPFQSKVKIQFSVFDNSNKTAIDTGTIYIIDKVNNEKQNYISGTFDFDFSINKKGYIKLELRDENRGRTVKEFIYIDKINHYNDQFFLVKDSTNNILYNSFISDENQVLIYSYFNQNKTLYANHNNFKFPLSQPPFSKSKENTFRYKTNKIESLTKNNDLSFNYDFPESGLVQFQLDSNEKNGFTLFRFQKYFPKIKTPIEMIHPIRYICTKAEFEKVLNSSDSKKAIDEFWLTKGNTSDISRELIKKYYARVEKANIYFTSHKEGWKTDRGMISIIFGAPKLVRKTNHSIVWTYGDENNMNSITFTFEKVKNPFSDNDYELIRNYNLKNPWYRAVDTWRNGKAYWIH